MIKRVHSMFSSTVRCSHNLRSWANLGRARVNRWGCHSDPDECQLCQCGGCRQFVGSFLLRTTLSCSCSRGYCPNTRFPQLGNRWRTQLAHEILPHLAKTRERKRCHCESWGMCPLCKHSLCPCGSSRCQTSPAASRIFQKTHFLL